MLDGAPLRWQVAAAIAAHLRARPEALAKGLAQARQQDLDGHPRAPEHDRLAAGPQERQRPALRERRRRAARATRRVQQGRIHEQHVPFAGRRAVAVDEHRARPVSIVASSRGLPMVAEQHTMTGCEP